MANVTFLPAISWPESESAEHPLHHCKLAVMMHEDVHTELLVFSNDKVFPITSVELPKPPLQTRQTSMANLKVLRGEIGLSLFQIVFSAWISGCN